MEEEMRNVCKKVIGMVLVTALLAGGLSGQADMAQAKAKKKAFSNEWCTLGGKTTEMADGSYDVVDTSFFRYDSEDYSSIRQGNTIFASIFLTPNSEVKSTSLKSSNTKVIRVSDRKKGTFKAVGRGTAKITCKVVWNCPPKEVSKWKNNKYTKCTKSGNTFTMTLTTKIKVICKKHKYGEWVTKKAATCEDEGEMERKCNACGRKDTKSVEETEHQYDPETGECTVCGSEKDE